jgi:hypothetical protein
MKLLRTLLAIIGSLVGAGLGVAAIIAGVVLLAQAVGGLISGIDAARHVGGALVLILLGLSAMVTGGLVTLGAYFLFTGLVLVPRTESQNGPETSAEPGAT